jgi:hypothetical protein
VVGLAVKNIGSSREKGVSRLVGCEIFLVRKGGMKGRVGGVEVCVMPVGFGGWDVQNRRGNSGNNVPASLCATRF